MIKISKELYIIILWSSARYEEKEILEDINKKLKILECIDVAWNKEKVAKNFTRFYGVKLDSGSSKEKECGTGRFLIVTVIDENPVYDFRETSRGHEYVNTKIFDLKQLYRSMTKGGHKIHTSNTPEETNHDITLLLGKNYEDYLKSAPEKWTGEIKHIERDLTGTNGWSSLEELFYTLNACSNYVVLRGLDEYKKGMPYIDIDIFTNDYDNLCFIINGIPEVNEYRPHYLTKIGNNNVYLDVWDNRKNYYDVAWQRNILKNKINNNGIYELNKEDAFFEFIYHCLIHKEKVKPSYYIKAEKLFNEINTDNTKIPECKTLQFEYYFELLKKFMRKNGYYFIKPDDLSVYYNELNLNIEEDIERLEKDYLIKNIKPFNIANRGASGCAYYSGYLNDKKVFIKTGGLGSICKNEFQITKLLYEKNNRNFLKPYFYKLNGDIKNIVLEFTEGIPLDKLIEENKLTEEDKDIIKKELENIAKTLIDLKISHRDLTPRNLIYTKDKKLLLIDMQWAVHLDNYYEDDIVINNPEIIKHLADDYAVCEFVWDDMHSISKTLAEINRKSDFIENNKGKFIVRLDYKDKNKSALRIFIEWIFSAKNNYNLGIKRKIITIFGIKISFKKKFNF